MVSSLRVLCSYVHSPPASWEIQILCLLWNTKSWPKASQSRTSVARHQIGTQGAIADVDRWLGQDSEVSEYVDGYCLQGLCSSVFWLLQGSQNWHLIKLIQVSIQASVEGFLCFADRIWLNVIPHQQGKRWKSWCQEGRLRGSCFCQGCDLERLNDPWYVNVLCWYMIWYDDICLYMIWWYMFIYDMMIYVDIWYNYDIYMKINWNDT